MFSLNVNYFFCSDKHQNATGNQNPKSTNFNWRQAQKGFFHQDERTSPNKGDQYEIGPFTFLHAFRVKVYTKMAQVFGLYEKST